VVRSHRSPVAGRRGCRRERRAVLLPRAKTQLQFIVPFPEQGCYVGFATASGRTPESVIDALSRVCNTITLELEPPDIETCCLNITDDVPTQQASDLSVLSSDDCPWKVLLQRALSVMADSSFGEFPGKQEMVGVELMHRCLIILGISLMQEFVD
jgi:hypothetical protein